MIDLCSLLCIAAVGDEEQEIRALIILVRTERFTHADAAHAFKAPARAESAHSTRRGVAHTPLRSGLVQVLGRAEANLTVSARKHLFGRLLTASVRRHKAHDSAYGT
jgi:hypothetical protein